MMHPIMAAAYNAALCELANGNVDSSRLSAVFPQHNGQGTRQIPLAVPAPLHFSPSYGVSPRAQPQTIIINAQNLHLDGNNANSLRSLLSRTNVNIHPPSPGRRGAAQQGPYGDRARGAGEQRGGRGVGVGAGMGVGAGEGGGFQRDPDGALRLQMQFQFNLMEVVRGILAVVFMHLILGLSILKVVMLVGTYFLLRALLRLNLHRGVARWFDGVAAHLMQPQGLAAPAAAGGEGAAGADPGAAAEPPPAAPQPPGTLRALMMGLLSFFLSLLPQFNADGADGDAIAAAQEDLNNQNNDNDAAMAF